MKRTIIEPSRTIAIEHTYDVVVAGAGIAGTAAAVAAARCGLETAVIERMCSPGGLAVLGNINIFLPLCDGYGHQVIGGLTEEMLLLSVKGREARIPTAWRKRAGTGKTEAAASSEAAASDRYEAEYPPAEYALGLEQLLVDSGVEIYYDTRICAAHREDDRLSALIVENKSGRFALAASLWIDATGDADVAHLSGAPTASLSSNVRAGWGYVTTGNGAARNLVVSKRFTEDGSPIPPGEDGCRYRGESGKSVTRQILESRVLLRKEAEILRTTEPSLEIVRISELPGFRMTRRLQGDTTIAFDDAGRWFPDSAGLFPSWRSPGPVWSLPFSSLCSRRVPNLAVVGRSLSAVGAAWDITRVIPVCTLSGEIAGTAAALCRESGRFVDTDIEKLRTRLTDAGNILDRNLLRPHAGPDMRQ